MPIIPYLLTGNGNFISNCMLCEILYFEFLEELFSLRRKKIDLTKTGQSLWALTKTAQSLWGLTSSINCFRQYLSKNFGLRYQRPHCRVRMNIQRVLHDSLMRMYVFQGITFQNTNFYHPQRSWGKVMFLHLCVILFTVGSWRHTPSGRYPLSRQPPPGQTPSHLATPQIRPL